MPRSTAMACFAPAPMGTACRRTSSGESTTRTFGVVEVLVERLPGPLEQHRVADGQHGLLRTLVLAPALHGQDDEIAALGDHPRKHRLADQAGSGRDDHLGQSGRPVEQRVRDVAGRCPPPGRRGPCRRPAPPAASALAAHDEMSPAASAARRSGPLRPRPGSRPGSARVLLQVEGDCRPPDVRRPGPHPRLEDAHRRAGTARRASGRGRLRSAGIARPLRSGNRRGPKSTMIAMVPRSSGIPDEGELEVAEGAHAGVRRRLRDEHVHGRAGERQQRPRVRREHEGHEQLRRRVAQPDRR